MTTEERKSVIDLLTELIKHPMIKEAHIADELFSDNPSTNPSSNRSRFNHRMKGNYTWKDGELRDILRIFERFADKIDSIRDAVAAIPEMRADYEQELARLEAELAEIEAAEVTEETVDTEVPAEEQVATEEEPQA